jgi:hypothetical protein
MRGLEYLPLGLTGYDLVVLLQAGVVRQYESETKPNIKSCQIKIETNQIVRYTVTPLPYLHCKPPRRPPPCFLFPPAACSLHSLHFWTFEWEHKEILVGKETSRRLWMRPKTRLLEKSDQRTETRRWPLLLSFYDYDTLPVFVRSLNSPCMYCTSACGPIEGVLHCEVIIYPMVTVINGYCVKFFNTFFITLWKIIFYQWPW